MQLRSEEAIDHLCLTHRGEQGNRNRLSLDEAMHSMEKDSQIAGPRSRMGFYLPREGVSSEKEVATPYM